MSQKRVTSRQSLYLQCCSLCAQVLGSTFLEKDEATPVHERHGGAVSNQRRAGWHRPRRCFGSSAEVVGLKLTADWRAWLVSCARSALKRRTVRATVAVAFEWKVDVDVCKNTVVFCERGYVSRCEQHRTPAPPASQCSAPREGGPSLWAARRRPDRAQSGSQM